MRAVPIGSQLIDVRISRVQPFPRKPSPTFPRCLIFGFNTFYVRKLSPYYDLFFILADYMNADFLGKNTDERLLACIGPQVLDLGVGPHADIFKGHFFHAK